MEQLIKCDLCGEKKIKFAKYNNFSLHLSKRKLPYLLPISYLLYFFPDSPYIKKLLINKKYFNRKKVRCSSCNLGFVYPNFNNHELSKYYEKQYWDFRDINEGKHLVAFDQKEYPKFSDSQLKLHQKRIDFIHRYISDYTTVLDFGSGDCSAASIFKTRGKVVTVIDFSSKSYDVAKQLGVNYGEDLSQLKNIDLVYSSHSLEHVSNILETFKQFLHTNMSTKYLFFETPNIQTDFIFQHLIHTPHTYMFNEKSFRAISKKFNLKILAIDYGGSHWSYFKKNKKNCMPDIRVLFQNNNLGN